jgi:hypothetical protein
MLSQEQKENKKPPLTPKQATMMSLVVLTGGLPLGILAYLFLLQPLHIVALWYMVVSYLMVCLSWSFLEWRTRNRFVRTWNAFIVYFLLLIVFVTLTQDNYEPFPSYGIFLLFLGGSVVAIVIGATALQNFRRWRKGEFQTDIEKPNQPIQQTR